MVAAAATAAAGTDRSWAGSRFHASAELPAAQAARRQAMEGSTSPTATLSDLEAVPRFDLCYKYMVFDLCYKYIWYLVFSFGIWYFRTRCRNKNTKLIQNILVPMGLSDQQRRFWTEWATHSQCH